MKVFVLGHRGMLGHVVARYLGEQACEVLTSNARYEGLPCDPLIEAVRESECEWVVNAAGLIKQKSVSPKELLLSNSLLPLQLKNRLRANQRLVQPSTDCVFSGHRGSYQVDDERDAADVYGLSKILAESVACADRVTVLRTSIIGPEPDNGQGLMAWFFRQNASVDGFMNHLWNGITTLEWARVCWEVIRGEHLQLGPILQIGTNPPVSKYELLRLINRTWEHEVAIRPVNAPEAIDRTLVPTLLRPALEQELVELKEWYWRR
jgi:dTDP-4-dehydrorhamnose reductase